ncbi:MAG: FHA domain-containing protein [Anaerolineae bacterium]
MTVEVWYGSKPHHTPEEETLAKLHRFLHPQSEHFALLFNFFAGEGSEIDLVVCKQNGIFLAELKHVWDPIFGNREGQWWARHADGTKIILNPDRPNPFKQAQRNYYSWKRWSLENATELNADTLPGSETDWSKVMTYVVLYPDLPESSHIEIGEWPVKALGLPAFLQELVTVTSSKVNLSPQTLSQIPRLIGLRRWLLPSTTEQLTDWQPSSFATLVARGHEFSMPVLRLDAEGKSYFTVGRGGDNDLIIHSPTVSRRHARLYKEQGQWIVEDENSTSGTFVSYTGDPAQETRVQERAFALQNHSIVRFGSASYTLLLCEKEGGS